MYRQVCITENGLSWQHGIIIDAEDGLSGIGHHSARRGYGSTQIPVGNGLYVMTHSSTHDKKKQLDKIAKELGIKLIVVSLAKVETRGSTSLPKGIGRLVYQLYSLTEEEIRIVEGNN